VNTNFKELTSDYWRIAMICHQQVQYLDKAQKEVNHIIKDCFRWPSPQKESDEEDINSPHEEQDS